MTGEPHNPDAVLERLKIAVLTASDTRTRDNDRSGNWIRERLLRAGHEITAAEIVPDDGPGIEATLRDWISLGIEVVIITGGTGLSPRDQVPEVIERVCPRLLPGFGELFRALSFEQIGAKTIASRAVAGVCEKTLIFSLPGSTAACRLGLEKVILPELVHLSRMTLGEGHEEESS